MKYFPCVLFVTSVLRSSAVSSALISHMLFNNIKLYQFFGIKNSVCQQSYGDVSDMVSFVCNKNAAIEHHINYTKV
jgi:hypothetical protein